MSESSEKNKTYFITSQGFQLFIHDMSCHIQQDTPLLVIHGGPDWDHSYLLLGLKEVAKQRRVIAFDIRGCGNSSKSMSMVEYQPEYVADDVCAIADALQLSSFDLLGFSTGGQVAQLVAERHPTRIRKLVLASTTAYSDFSHYFVEWTEFQKRKQKQAQIRESYADMSPASLTKAWALDSIPLNIWDLSFMEACRDILNQTIFTDSWYQPFISGHLHSWRPQQPVKVLKNLKRPVLILHGEKDMIFPVQVAEKLHKEVPNSQLAIIPEAGHLAYIEELSLWTLKITEFLNTPLTGFNEE